MITLYLALTILGKATGNVLLFLKTSIDMLSSSQTAKNSNIWQQPSMATLLKEATPTLK